MRVVISTDPESGEEVPSVTQSCEMILLVVHLKTNCLIPQPDNQPMENGTLLRVDRRR